jgi:hypothetical protein
MEQSYEYPETLDDLHDLFDELSVMRKQVAGRIASLEGNEASQRRSRLMGAMVIGSAGAHKLPEEPGIAHLLAMQPTRAELVALLTYVASTNRDAMSMLGNNSDDDDTRVFNLERSILIERNELLIARAIEIVDEVNEWQGIQEVE